MYNQEWTPQQEPGLQDWPEDLLHKRSLTLPCCIRDHRRHLPLCRQDEEQLDSQAYQQLRVPHQLNRKLQKGLASSIFASQIPPYLVQITACQRGASSPLNPPQNPRSTIQKKLANASHFL